MIDPSLQGMPGMEGTVEPIEESMSPADPAVDPAAADPMQQLDPSMQIAEPPAPEPDALDEILLMPGPDAIRLVYQLSTSAAQNKKKLRDYLARGASREYHALLSSSPEVQYADELITARTRLDHLAKERRRIQDKIGSGNASLRADRSNGLYDSQISALTSAMEQVAGGTLMFIYLPSQ